MTIPPELTAALADRYRMDRVLGEGGMATVYLAHDLKHDRPVALKVLKPELAMALGAERFEREIKLAARLQHPHILTVHDSGDANGQLWFTMPFVEGENLRHRLEREKQLPVDDALRITREAAQALQYAHEHGVVHRDIKPENLLLTKDGSTLVADFGIARSLGQSDGPALTQTGTSIGTAAYMSPEQAAGERDLDARSDIYSLGIVLYEMLAGATPFEAPTPQAMIARRFTETAKPLRAMRDSVPERVEAAVQKALARTAADRFATAREFAEALASPAAVTQTRPPAAPKPRRRFPIALTTLVLGFLVGLGVLFAWRQRQPANPPTGAHLIAVLPFQNLGDSADSYFADGMTDEVRGKLSSLPELRVIAGGSSSEYKGTSKSLAEIGKELGVDYLLVGKVRWAKAADGTSRVRVSPELVQVGRGEPTSTWQQAFDAKLTDVFEVQAQIATQVAAALGTQLGTSEQAQLATRPTANSAAYDLYLKAIALTSRDVVSQREASGYLEQAVALDSTFTRGWSALAYALSLVYYNGNRDPAVASRTRQAMTRALELDSNDTGALRAAATYYLNIDPDPAKAATLIERALRLAPNDADLLSTSANADRNAGRLEAAIAKLERARRVDPRSANILASLQSMYLLDGRTADAVSAGSAALALAPHNLQTIETQAMAHVAQGDLGNARRVVQTAIGAGVTAPEIVAFFGGYNEVSWILEPAQQELLLRLTPAAFDNDKAWWAETMATAYWERGNRAAARAYADSGLAAALAQVKTAPRDWQLRALYALMLAYHGDEAEARKEIAQAIAARQQDMVGDQSYLKMQIARVALALDDTNAALGATEALLQTHTGITPAWLRIDPTFNSLRGNPRFQKLVAKPAS